MLAKNILGIFILLFNTAGLGFLLFQGVQALKQGFSPGKPTPAPDLPKGGKTGLVPPPMIPDADDLLRDMDLSDLDDLDLDDLGLDDLDLEDLDQKK